MQISEFRELNIRSSISDKSSRAGWLLAVLLSTLFVILYVATIIVTKYMNDGNFQYRAWNWTKYLIGICSIIVIIKSKNKLKIKYVLLGLFFSLICGISFLSRVSGDISTITTESIIVVLAFVAGCTIRSNGNSVRVSLIDTSINRALKSFGLGIVLSIPFAMINFLYFAISQGKIEWENPLYAMFMALEPGIAEEIIFRFFIINIIYELLKDKLSQKPLIIFIFIMGVLPHSLLHYPDLWLINIPGALFMMVSTCILFGLPMAYLQCKRDMEAAVGFHWLIDALRFFGGF